MGVTSFAWLLIFASMWWSVTGSDEQAIQIITKQTAAKELSKKSQEMSLVQTKVITTRSKSGDGQVSIDIRKGKSSHAESLTGLLTFLVQQEYSSCRLLLAYDESNMYYSKVVQDQLNQLSNPSQVGVAWFFQ